MEKTKKRAITIEDYELFLQNPSEDALNIPQLKEVILMHGFKKISKRPKSVLYDALMAIDLIKLQRSTLEDKLSPHCSSVTLDTVKQDLEAIGWQECHIHSIENICQPKANTNSSGDVVSKDDGIDPSITCFEIGCQKGGTKRKRKWRTASLVNDGGAAACSKNISAVSTDVIVEDSVTAD